MARRPLPAPRVTGDDPVSATLLSVEGLTKRYRTWTRSRGVVPRVVGVDALAGMSFGVGAGEIVALLGPNGSGKTTVMKVALGLASADAGSCVVLGHAVPRGLRSTVRGAGAIIETPRFAPGLTAHQTLDLLGRIQRIPDDRVRSCLATVGLAPFGDRRVGTFSLGMRQRLALAAALLRRPALLLLDEPANGLDPAGMQQLRVVLRRFAGDGGGVLVSSHGLAEVQALANRVVIVARGRTLLAGSLTELTSPGRSLEDRYLAVVGAGPSEGPVSWGR